MFSHKQPRIFDIRPTSDVSDNETDKINKYIFLPEILEIDVVFH